MQFNSIIFIIFALVFFGLWLIFRRRNMRWIYLVVVEVLLEFVSRWNGLGINVHGFMLPMCKEMAELEAEVSGLNQLEFIEAFEQAGGVWIDVDQSCYESFDGSHLQDVGALEFSRFLAISIRDIELQENTFGN